MRFKTFGAEHEISFIEITSQGKYFAFDKLLKQEQDFQVLFVERTDFGRIGYQVVFDLSVVIFCLPMSLAREPRYPILKGTRIS